MRVARGGPGVSLSLPEKEAREPKTCILLVIGKTIGLLSQVQWFSLQLTKDKSRVHSPVATKMKKKGKS